MEVYYNSKARENQYDITVEATVINADLKPQGIYRVKTDSAEFDAYTTTGNYYKNDIVMVQIPNGNYSNPKYILGRRSDGDEDYKFNLKLPFDDFIGLRRLSKEDHSDIIGEKGYWANYPEYHNIFNEDEVKECLSKRQEILDTPIWEWTNSGSSTIGTTRLGIEADWKVLLGKYAPIRGNYGFRIVVKGVSGSTEVDASTAKEETYFFTNRDMYGSVYSFITFYNQQKVIDISEFLNIHSIKMYFFQDFEFADSLNAPISYKAN